MRDLRFLPGDRVVLPPGLGGRTGLPDHAELPREWCRPVSLTAGTALAEAQQECRDAGLADCQANADGDGYGDACEP